MTALAESPESPALAVASGGEFPTWTSGPRIGDLQANWPTGPVEGATSAAHRFDLEIGDLAALGVRLSLRGIHLRIAAPDDVLTPELIATLKRHKSELVEATRLASPCSKCGSTSYVDHSIHAGRSVRRDCATCGQTKGFPTWSHSDHPPSPH